MPQFVVTHGPLIIIMKSLGIRQVHLLAFVSLVPWIFGRVYGINGTSSVTYNGTSQQSSSFSPTNVIASILSQRAQNAPLPVAATTTNSINSNGVGFGTEQFSFAAADTDHKTHNQLMQQLHREFMQIPFREQRNIVMDAYRNRKQEINSFYRDLMRQPRSGSRLQLFQQQLMDSMINKYIKRIDLMFVRMGMMPPSMQMQLQNGKMAVSVIPIQQHSPNQLGKSVPIKSYNELLSS